ncbi:MAG: protein phosphatase 2C domain-containing protein [Chloroflexota bacterium]
MPATARRPTASASTAAQSGEVLTAALSNIGASPRRTLLEDRSRAGVIHTAGGLEIALGIVADGIGGENAGERAAEITVSTVFEHCERSTERDIPSLLRQALEEANRRVFADARGSRRKLNMGSTAAVAAVTDGRLYVANVGDSRVYLVRQGRAVRLTIDHTWEEEVVRLGRLSAAEAARHPRREEIVRSIGFDRDLQVDLGLWLQGGREDPQQALKAQGMALEPGDQIVICSDGLTKTRHDRPETHYVDESEIPALIGGKAPRAAAETLVRRALSARVDDNVSVAILQMPGGKRVSAPIRLHPAIPAGLALALVAGGAAMFLPRLLGSANPLAPTPTIPPLPSGVAFVSELAGGAEVETPSAGARPLAPEDIVAAGPGVVLRTGGAGSYLRLGLADQSIVYIGPDSEVELAAIADGAQTLETTLRIRRGVVVVSSQAGPQRIVAVIAPGGASGRVRASVMGVIYDSLAQRLDADCFSGTCEAVDVDSGHPPVTLRAGQHVFLGADGSVSQADATRNALYSFADYCGGLVPAPAGAVEVLAPTRTPLGPLFVPPTQRPTIRPTDTRREAPSATPTPVPTDTPEPTNTPRPTRTPRPTETPVPTDTPEPPTPTDTPELPTPDNG